MPKIRTLMIDLEASREAYWRHNQTVSYQWIWQQIRQLLAHTYQAVVSGAELPDDTLRIQTFGVDVAVFEIK